MRIALPMTALLLTASLLALAAPAAAVDDDACIGQPGTVAACYVIAPTGTCVSAGVGLQGGSVCVGSQGFVRVCTSLYTALYGNCPTDLLR